MYQETIRIRIPQVEKDPTMRGAEALAVAFNLADAAGFQDEKFDFQMGGGSRKSLHFRIC